MDDHIELYGDLDELIAGIESGLEQEMYDKRWGHHLERDARLHVRAQETVAPTMLEDIEPEPVDEEPLC